MLLHMYQDVAYEKEGVKYLPEPIEIVDDNIFTHMVQKFNFV